MPVRDPGRADDQWALKTVTSSRPRQRDLLKVIWHSRNSELVEQAVNHPAVLDQTLLWAAVGPRLSVHASVVATCTRATVLRIWARSPDAEVRVLAAFNPATPADVAIGLLSDPIDAVRANAAYHPGIPEQSLLRAAAGDESRRVRDAAQDALGTDFGRALRAGQRSVIVQPDRGQDS